ncbi:fimbrial protein [Salmonella enterica]|nr:fimbrial protein [Salmonella enterica]EME7695731.1 fimbrial protein [Salmonella enterica]
MKKILFLSVILIGLGMPIPGLANNSFSSNRTGGTITSLITMTVKTPTCVIKPYNQDIDFKRITTEELLNESRNLTANISFECDTTPAGITLEISPAGGNRVVHGQPGVIDSSLTGAGFKLSWGKNSSVGTENQVVDYNKPLVLSAARVSAINLIITPVMITGGGTVSGVAQTQVNLTVNYS